MLENAIMTTLLTIMTVCSIIKNTNMLLMQLISNEELYSHSDQADVMVEQCTSTIKKRKANFRLNNKKKRKKWGLYAGALACMRQDLPKTSAIYDLTMTEYNDSQFKEFYGVNRSTFNYLCDALRPLYSRVNNERFGPKGGNKAVSFQKAVAITLYRVTSTCNTRRIAAQF